MPPLSLTWLVPGHWALLAFLVLVGVLLSLPEALPGRVQRVLLHGAQSVSQHTQRAEGVTLTRRRMPSTSRHQMETCTLDPGPGGGRQRRGPVPGTARDSREDRLFLCGWGESRHFSQFSCSLSGSLSHSQLSCFGLGRLLCGVRGGGGQGERGMEA